MRSKRAVSLLEAIVAIFLLTGGSLACFTLLIQAFRFQARSQQVTDATLVAEQTMEGIRCWALQPANFDTDWSIYANSDITSNEVPGFVSRVTVSNLKKPGNVLTPCFRVVNVSVRSGSRQVLSLTGQIGSPLRNPTLVTVEPESALSVGLNGTLKFQAYLQDSTAATVPGVSFHWSLLPYSNPPQQPGLGTVEAVGPNQGLLTHVLYAPTPPDPNPIHDPGWLKVRATCRYRGKLIEGDSALVELTP